METNNWSHAATVFAVNDIQASIKFYTEVLEMNLAFSWGEPVTYAVLKRADVSVHLSLKEDDSQPSKTHTRLYIFVHNIQQAFEDIVDAGGQPLNQPEQQDYAMTDFDLKDPDGHIISFGSGQ